MKILLTGGLGFIGSNLAKRCVEEKHVVTILDNLDPNSGGNIYNVNDFKDDVKIVDADISKYEEIKDYVRDNDIIINCAASTSHLQSMKKPWENLNVNSKGVLNLLEAIRRNNITAKMIHLSTTTQLGTLHYQPADEFHPEFPTDIYSANKMVSEKYCLIYPKAFGMKSCVIRLCNVFGPRAAIHSPEFTFNNYFIGLALKNKPITVYEPGSQLRNILYVDDAVSAILAAVDKDKSIGNTFFSVSDEHYSVKEIAEKTCKIMGGSVQMIDWPKDRKAIEIGDAVISNQKIKETLGWEPKVKLEEGLKLTFNYYKDKLDHYLK